MSGMDAIYRSEEGRRLVEGRYRDLLTSHVLNEPHIQ